MSLEDMTVTVTQHFPASPEVVWALLTDVETMAGLGPEHVNATWEGAGRGLGATFVGRNRIGDREWQVPCTITAYDEPRRFAWAVGRSAAPASHWAYELTPDDGGTTVAQTFTHGPGLTFLRQSCERHPDRAEEFVNGRAEMLRTNMTTVLGAAATRLA